MRWSKLKVLKIGKKWGFCTWAVVEGKMGKGFGETSRMNTAKEVRGCGGFSGKSIAARDASAA